MCNNFEIVDHKIVKIENYWIISNCELCELFWKILLCAKNEERYRIDSFADCTIHDDVYINISV